MSTEATGDGQAGAVGAVEEEVAAQSTEPSATVVTEPEGAEPADADAAAAWDTEAASAWGTPEATDVGDAEGAETSESAGADEVPASDEIDETANSGGVEESEESGESDEDYDDYADGDASEYDEALEYDENGENGENDGEYGEYEPEEAAEPRRARWWPRALLALGFVILGAAIVGGAIVIVGKVTNGFKKPVKVTYTKSAVFSLKTGECFDPQGPQGQSYSLVSCDAQHVAEVFATFTLSGSKWPGAAAVAQEASSGCSSRLTGYLNPQLAINLTSKYVYPDSVAWQAGTRTVICEVRAASGELTGSVAGASATAS